MPTGLTRDERRVWTHYATELHAAGRLTRAVQGVLASYVTALTTIARLKTQMAAPGYVDVTEDGKSPLLPELRNWIGLARLLESDLLLNPAAAVRVPSVVDDAIDDEWADFDTPRVRPAQS